MDNTYPVYKTAMNGRQGKSTHGFYSNIMNDCNYDGNCTLISFPAGTPKIACA